MTQGEEEIIIIGGGKKPKVAAAEGQTVYDRAREMIDEAEAAGTPISFESKGKD